MIILLAAATRQLTLERQKSPIHADIRPPVHTHKVPHTHFEKPFRSRMPAETLNMNWG